MFFFCAWKFLLNALGSGQYIFVWKNMLYFTFIHVIFYNMTQYSIENLFNFCSELNRTTQYTPYQPEIAQGRLESLLNFQTLVSEMTGLEIANASLLDEGTAAAEAMTLCTRHNKRKKLFVSDRVHPQTIALIKTRTEPLGLEVIVGPAEECNLASRDISGILIQYPDTCGNIKDYTELAKTAHKNGVIKNLFY